MKARSEETTEGKEIKKKDLLEVFFIISVTPRVLVFLPVLAMFTCGQQNNIFPVVDVIQSISRFRSDAS